MIQWGRNDEYVDNTTVEGALWVQLSLLIRACSQLITSLPRLPGTDDELEAHYYRFRSFFEMCNELIRVMLHKFDLVRDVIGEMRTNLIGVIQGVAEGDRAIHSVDGIIHREIDSFLMLINMSGRTTTEFRYTLPLANVSAHYHCLESLPDPFATDDQNWAFDTVAELINEFEESVMTARTIEDIRELFGRFRLRVYDHLRSMYQVEDWNKNWDGPDLELGDDTASIASSANDTNNVSIASNLSVAIGSDDNSLFSSVAEDNSIIDGN